MDNYFVLAANLAAKTKQLSIVFMLHIRYLTSVFWGSITVGRLLSGKVIQIC